MSESGEQVLEAEHIILAAGSAVDPADSGMDLPGVLTSDELFRMKSVRRALQLSVAELSVWNSQRFTQNLAVR